jgi:hypothetical protein
MSLKCFRGVDPSRGGGWNEALERRFLRDSKFGAGPSIGPWWDPVTEMRLTAAFKVGLVPGRHSATLIISMRSRQVVS